MSNLLFVAIQVILPIFLLIAIGFGLQKKVQLNTSTMAKLQFYIFIPALMFTKIQTSTVSFHTLIIVSLIMISIFLILLIFGVLISRILHYKRNVQSSFVNSIVFFNSANYCIPLITFLYDEKLLASALSIQVIIMLVQSILINTFGIFNTNAGTKTVKDSIKETLKIPIVYVTLLGFILRGYTIWGPIWKTLTIIGNGMISLALITLGAQLATTKINFKLPKIHLANFTRLIISPVLAIILVKLLGISGVEAQVIVICSGAPTAVNTVLMAIQYNNEPELSSQIVFSSTVLSAITISVLISLSQMMFPI